MTTTAVHPGGANTFVPSPEATHNMRVDFSRNINSFPLNRYLYIVPVTKMVGIFTRMTVEEAGRLLNGGEDAWPVGTARPRNAGRTEKFELPKYSTFRRQFGYEIPGETAEQAAWDILKQHGDIIAQRAMTRRTERVATLLQNASNWPATNKVDVDDIPAMNGAAGQWDQSTTARLAIKKSLRYGTQAIKKQTLGAVSSKDLKLVIGDEAAGAMAESQEIADFVKGSPHALDYIKNNLGPNATYGLPESMYGVEIIVEDAVKVTTRKGASSVTKSFVWDSDSAVLLYRAAGKAGSDDGGLAGPSDSNEAPTFSTLTCFMYEEMTVESKYDSDDRLNLGRIVENYDMQITAPISGFLFTDIMT